VLADFCGSSGSEQAHDAGLACLNRLIGERNIIRDTPVPKLLKERLIQERLLEGESVSAEVRAAETVELQLDRIFQRSLAQLSIGAADRQHAFHRATLATMGLDGEPKQRTVNVRGFDPERNLLHIFTDKRSIKVTELKANPAVGLCFYDDTSRTQILLSGKAQSFMNDDDHKQTAWAKISEDEYPYYACPVAPGKELPEPHAVSSSTIVAPIGTDYLRASARENFALIEVHFNVLDWVVAQGTNCFRARFKLSDGTWHGSWVAS
jgi:general stress protein 26